MIKLCGFNDMISPIFSKFVPWIEYLLIYGVQVGFVKAPWQSKFFCLEHEILSEPTSSQVRVKNDALNPDSPGNGWNSRHTYVAYYDRISTRVHQGCRHQGKAHRKVVTARLQRRNTNTIVIFATDFYITLGKRRPWNKNSLVLQFQKDVQYILVSNR